MLVSHIISMFLPIQAIVCHGTMGRLLRPMIGTMTRTSITTTARTAPSLSMEPGGTQAATTQTWTGITRILHLAKASTGITSPATTSHWPRWRWNWGGREIYLWLTWPMCNDVTIGMMCRRYTNLIFWKEYKYLFCFPLLTIHLWSCSSFFYPKVEEMTAYWIGLLHLQLIIHSFLVYSRT